MPRRKQHCPKRMEPGEDGEGGGSLAVKGNSEPNEEEEQEQIVPKSEATIPTTKRLSATVKLETEDMDCGAGREAAGVTPLDFSVKAVACDKRRRTPSATDDAPKEKIKAESTSFPLDLSVKRTSVSPNLQSPAKSQHSPAHPPRQTATNAVAKFSSRSHESRNLSSCSPPSASLTFSSPSSRVPAVNGSDRKKTFPGAMGSATRSVNSHGRQNPWQTQWINRSSEQTRDVFTCVWCKESFRSLQEMTMHMKESPRCGMAGMQHAAAASLSSSSSQQSPSSSSSSTHPVASATAAAPSASPLANGSKSRNSGSNSALKEPMSNAVLAKNNVTLPRKLVRGQDVWLGRGAEQTRQILKCMWCAQSFKTLDEMTRHMRVTQHYTNIISQEQIISWRTPEDKLAQAQVNAVLTCKVCDQAFGSLKELSYHMVKNAHYKEHILRSITEGGHGRRRQTRERRKKSLPVRKLLELERMEIPLPHKSSEGSTGLTTATATRIQRSQSRSPNASPDGSTCDDCGRVVQVVGHMADCKRRGSSPERIVRSPSSGASSGPPSRSQTESPAPTSSSCQAAKRSKSEDRSDRKEDSGDEGPGAHPPPPQSSSACLSALQSLIDKSFDVKAAAAAATSATAAPVVPSLKSSAESRRVNGSRASSQRKLPLTASLSAVEKWMTLAKERDAPPIWSSSVSSSSSSSWLCSDDEEAGQSAAKRPASQTAGVRPADGSPAAGTSRPASVSSPTAGGDVSNKHGNKKRLDEDGKERNEDAERREEIEELKRTANNKVSDGAVAAEAKASSSASLSALERLIEKSFDSKKKNTPTGFLQRLGIDEEVCPPWQPGLGLGLTAMSFAGHPFQPWLIPKHESARSDSSSPSKGTKNGSLSSSPPV